jgi:photosystem II stability/assembly factor-like uncharacterized protein
MTQEAYLAKPRTSQNQDVPEESENSDPVYTIVSSAGFGGDGICFAGRPSGLYRSADGGQTWDSAYRSLKLEADLATPTVALSPHFPSDHTVWAGVQGAVLRSFDGGQSWEVILLPTPPPLVSGLIPSPNYEQDNLLFAATMEAGVLRSPDRGSHWHMWNFGLLDLRVLVLAISPGFAADETLFAGTETGLFRSTNGGRAWRETGFPTEAAPVLSLALSPSYLQDGTLLAGTDEAGLYCSADRGRTWSRLGEDVFTGSINAILLSSNYPARPHILVLDNDRLMFSDDGGQSWEPWPAAEGLDESITAVVAPYGTEPGAPLLVGLLDGHVMRI